MELPEKTKLFLAETGGLAGFAGRFIRQAYKPRFEISEFIRQCYLVGYKSFPLIGLTGFIMGLVLTMQLWPRLVNYGVETELPVIVGDAIIREIGPVITALIFAGKIGSSIGAELGSMRVTEQIDAMEVSGTNPFKYLVITRVFACTLMLPVLAILSDAVSLYGSYIGMNISAVTSAKLFFAEVLENLEMGSFIAAVGKCIFFGFAVGIVGCYKGYYSQKGTEGVGRSANSAVVVASLLVFVLDLLAVQLTNLLGID